MIETQPAGVIPLIVLDYLKPIRHLLLDEDVTDILVNQDGKVWKQKHGVMDCESGVHITARFLEAAIQNIARPLNDEFCATDPLLDSMLPDGSRVAAVYYGPSVTGIVLAIRKFRREVFKLDELVDNGTITARTYDGLFGALITKKTILISGATGSGKSTLLNAVANQLSASVRVVLLEDTPELRLELPNLVRLQVRKATPNSPAVTMQQLLRTTLRLLPDRIIVGEVRGAEAIDMLETMNTGHPGSMTTIHANSALDALYRVRTCCAMADVEIPWRALGAMISTAFKVVVHIGQNEFGQRAVREVCDIDGYHGDTDKFEVTPWEL